VVKHISLTFSEHSEINEKRNDFLRGDLNLFFSPRYFFCMRAASINDSRARVPLFNAFFNYSGGCFLKHAIGKCLRRTLKTKKKFDTSRFGVEIRDIFVFKS